MRSEKKKLPLKEETNTPLTDEEFREYQEKDARTTKKVLGFFSDVWEAILLFFQLIRSAKPGQTDRFKCGMASNQFKA